MYFDSDREADRALRDLLHRSLDNELGLAMSSVTSDDEQRKMAHMHHCREILLALVGLIQWKGDDVSYQLARKLVRTIEKLTRDTGTFPATLWSEEKGWHSEHPFQFNSTSGRLVRALVQYYRATHDDLAIDLARRLADFNISQTFTVEGKLKEAAGTHLHSTEGTMTGIIDLGIVCGEDHYVETGHRLYDVGLRPWRTSYGWSKETRNPQPGRGEANNTGDFVESAILLASYRYPEYFQDAERFIRNALLACQMVNVDWIAQSNKEDTEEYIYSDIRQRVRGGFAFSRPNSLEPTTSYNTDLVGGSLQSLAEAYHAIISHDSDGTHLNMLFSADSHWLSVRSRLPEKGEVFLRLHRPGPVFVHLPDWVHAKSLQIEINGRPVPVERNGQRISLGKLALPSHVMVRFDLPLRTTREKAPGFEEAFEIDWLGDTIVAMSPTAAPMALY